MDGVNQDRFSATISSSAENKRSLADEKTGMAKARVDNT